MMELPLDLSITLDKVPAGAAPETIATIALSCNALGLNHTDDVLSDPLTQQERDELRWYLEEYWHFPYYEFAQRGREAEIEAELMVTLMNDWNAALEHHSIETTARHDMFDTLEIGLTDHLSERNARRA
jgi:hypothetical protein